MRITVLFVRVPEQKQYLHANRHMTIDAFHRIESLAIPNGNKNSDGTPGLCEDDVSMYQSAAVVIVRWRTQHTSLDYRPIES